MDDGGNRRRSERQWLDSSVQQRMEEIPKMSTVLENENDDGLLRQGRGEAVAYLPLPNRSMPSPTERDGKQANQRDRR